MSAHAAGSFPLFLSPLRRLWEAHMLGAAPVSDIQKLPDHLLLDIGVRPRDPAGSANDRLYLMRHGFSRP